MTVTELASAKPRSQRVKSRKHLRDRGHGTAAAAERATDASFQLYALPSRPPVGAHDGLMARVARPLLAALAVDLAATPFTAVLKDRSGNVIDRVCTGIFPRFRGTSPLTSDCLCEGASVGGEPIDPAAMRRAFVVVRAEEEFTPPTAVKRVDVHDLRNGHMIAVLEMHCPVKGSEALALALGRRVVEAIEQRLLDEVGMAEKAVLYRFLRERHRAKGPFVFVSERTIIPNAAADRLIGPSDDDSLRRWAAVLAEGPSDEAAQVTLSNGVTVLVRAEVVRGPDQPPGVLLHILARPQPPSHAAGRAVDKSVFGWESLTDTERSVSELVTQGLTNREVGERLFISKHTVDSHLRCIFRKLGVNSRVQLARAAQGSGS